jgi:hypothetical protein
MRAGRRALEHWNHVVGGCGCDDGLIRACAAAIADGGLIGAGTGRAWVQCFLPLQQHTGVGMKGAGWGGAGTGHAGAIIGLRSGFGGEGGTRRERREEAGRARGMRGWRGACGHHCGLEVGVEVCGGRGARAESAERRRGQSTLMT